MSTAKWIERSYYVDLEMLGDKFIGLNPLRNPYYYNKTHRLARMRFFKNLKRHKNLKKLIDK